MTWADAMGLVVLEGLVILVLVLTGFRHGRLPRGAAQLKVAISVGIGLFIALIGFVDAGFVRTPTRPTPPCRSSSASSGQLPGLAGRWCSSSAWPARRPARAPGPGAILISIVPPRVLAIIVEAVVDLGDGQATDSTPAAGARPSRAGPTT